MVPKMVAVHFPNNGGGETRGSTVGVRVSGLNNTSTELPSTPNHSSALAMAQAETPPANHRNMMIVTQQ